MEKTTAQIVISLSIALLIFSCSSSSSETETQNDTIEKTSENDSSVNPEGNPSNQEDKLTTNEVHTTNNSLMESESFKRVAAFLPESVKGVSGEPFEGWVEGINGSKYTYVKKSYRDQENKTRIDLSISDAGKSALNSLGLINYWFDKKINNKLENGYEKTTTFESYPVYEKCQANKCDIYLVLGDRFLVGAYIENLDTKDVYQFFKTLNIEQLERLPK